MVHTVPWPHHLFLLCSYAFWIFISHQDFSWILEIHLLARHLHLGVLWQRLASFTPSQIISFSSFSLLYLQTTFPSLFFFFSQLGVASDDVWLIECWLKLFAQVRVWSIKSYIYLLLSTCLPAVCWGSSRKVCGPRVWLDHRWTKLKSLNYYEEQRHPISTSWIYTTKT